MVLNDMDSGHIDDASLEQLQEIYDLTGRVGRTDLNWDWMLKWADGNASHNLGLSDMILILRTI
jgi:hypothetical protein